MYGILPEGMLARLETNPGACLLQQCQTYDLELAGHWGCYQKKSQGLISSLQSGGDYAQPFSKVHTWEKCIELKGDCENLEPAIVTHEPQLSFS